MTSPPPLSCRVGAACFWMSSRAGYSCALHKLCPQTMPETGFSRVVINAHRKGLSSNKMNV